MTYMPDIFKQYKKDIPVTTKLNRHQYEELKKYCDKYDLNMSFVIRQLIDNLLLRYN